MPVNAPVMEFPRRFVDRGVGFAVGWMYWFAWCVGASDQLVAIARTINFKYDDGRTFLDWNGGNYVDSAVWISIFLFLAICVNMLPAKVTFDSCLTLFCLLTFHARFTATLNILLGALSWCLWLC